MEDFNKQQEEFELIREKIKSRPLNRKKLLRRIVITVLMAIIFGTCACITFFFLEKYFTKVMNPNNMEPVSSEVVIPIDETEMLPQDMMLEEEEEKQNRNSNDRKHFDKKKDNRNFDNNKGQVKKDKKEWKNSDKNDKHEKHDKSERPERSDRNDKSEKFDKSERNDKKNFKKGNSFFDGIVIK